MSEPDLGNMWEESMCWPHAANIEEPNPVAVRAARLKWERRERESRVLTADEVSQLKAIGRETSKGTWFTAWGWQAECHWLGLYSNRRKHILQAHRALREAGWPASIERGYDPGWNNRTWVPEFVKIDGINYYSWRG